MATRSTGVRQANTSSTEAAYADQEIRNMCTLLWLLDICTYARLLCTYTRLMPKDVDLRWQLLNGPSLLYSVQRGTKQLGPGAEF